MREGCLDDAPQEIYILEIFGRVHGHQLHIVVLGNQKVHCTILIAIETTDGPEQINKTALSIDAEIAILTV